MSRWNLGWLIGLFAATLIGLSASHSAPSDNALQKKHENIRLLVDVLEEVQQKYVRKLDSDKMRELVEDMINSGLEHLDRHSSFINKEEYKQFQRASRGHFGGVGIRIGLHPVTNQVIVETPLVGTPAYKAGIQAGDLIVKIDGKSTEALSLKRVVEAIQGEPGQKVTLTVLHEGQKKPVDIPIVRAEIQIDSVLGDTPLDNPDRKWQYWIDADNKIAYIRLTAFTETTVDELTKVVAYLQRNRMRGLVIDLRDNPGGLLRAAVEVSSLFLPEGERIVSTKGRNQHEETFNAKANPNLPPVTNVPIAILINRWSASASEIVAAALQDHLRAVIIGERSYGKGSVQNVIPMEDGASALKLTTASYWRPSGRNIHRFPDSKEEDEWGVRPDKGYEIKLTDEERKQYYKWRRERDVLRRPGAAPAKSAETSKKAPFHDRVLEKALDYLRGELHKNAGGDPSRPRAAAPALQGLQRGAVLEGAEARLNGAAEAGKGIRDPLYVLTSIRFRGLGWVRGRCTSSTPL
jgi:carboxyl-terminal processing protease